MTQLLPESFHTRVGLSSIEIADEPTTPQLPEDSRLQPIDAAVERQLEAMLQAETFEKVVLDALRPCVQDQSILHPSIYHSLREEVLASLQETLGQESDPEAARALRDAMDLLHHLGAAHELGEQYRYALLKG